MRKIRDVLRLKHEASLSHERVATATGLSKGAVTKYLQRAAQAGIGWPVPEGVDDAQLEARLFNTTLTVRPGHHAEPGYARMHLELKRRGVTLQLLWEEYHAAEGDRAYCYSQFCERYRRFASSLKRSMRQVHRAGDKLFIDYSGVKAEVIDAMTGEIRLAEIFVAVLGASQYTFAEATWTQQLPDWIDSHVRCFEYLGGAPALLVPDNLLCGAPDNKLSSTTYRAQPPSACQASSCRRAHTCWSVFHTTLRKLLPEYLSVITKRYGRRYWPLACRVRAPWP